MNFKGSFVGLALVSVLALAGCGGSAAPASSAPASAPPSAAPSSRPASAAPAASAKPSAAASAKASGKAAASIAPAPPGVMLSSYSELTPINLPLWVGVDAGIFKQNGLDVEARLIESSLGVGALLSDQVNFAAMGGSETLAAAVGGADLTVLATLSPVYPYKLEVNSSIKTAEDLKGKKLGISRIGSSSDSATHAALRKLGIDPSEVQLIQVGSLAARTAALMSGALDGGVHSLPDTINLEAHGFHPLIDLAGEHLPAVNNTLVARGAWVQAHKGITQKYVNAIVDGIAKVEDDEPLAITEIQKYLKTRGSNDAAMKPTYDFYANEVFRIPPVTTPNLFADSFAELTKKNPKANGFDVKKIIDNSFVENAVKEGHGKVKASPKAS